MSDRTMSVTVGFSSAQLEDLGVPEWMSESALADVLDAALLADPTALRVEVDQWIEDHINDHVADLEYRASHPDTPSLEDTTYDHANPANY